METIVYEDFEPKVDMQQEKEKETLILLLPGFKKDQLRVHLTSKGVLKISGERPLEGNRRNRFTKEFTIPENRETDGISAKFDNSVLFITLPKKLTPAPRHESLEKLLKDSQAAEATEPQPPETKPARPTTEKPQPPPLEKKPQPFEAKPASEAPKKPQPPPLLPPAEKDPKTTGVAPEKPQPPSNTPPLPEKDDQTAAAAELKDDRKYRSATGDRESLPTDGKAKESEGGGRELKDSPARQKPSGSTSTDDDDGYDSEKMTEEEMNERRKEAGGEEELKKRNWGDWMKLIVGVLLGLMFVLYVKSYISSFTESHDDDE